MRRITPLLTALIVTLVGIVYMTFNVVYSYGGNVSGLFYTSPKMDLPPEIAAHTFRVKDEQGYDAEYYHLSAHDVLMQRGYWRYVDNPQLRWRRIAIPALASLLSGGGTGLLTDIAYVSIQTLFLFAGAWWLASYATAAGLPAIAGAAFLLVPAVLVSLDRMTIDLPLAALTVGLIWLANRKATFAILVLAPLVRETGIILVAGWCLWNALHKQWRQVATGTACALPALAWWAWVRAVTTPDATPWLASYPLAGLIERTFAGNQISGATAWLRLAGITEQLAVAGIWLALALAVFAIVRRPKDLPEIAAILFAVFASMLGKADIWETAYATGRTMSPLLVLLLLIGVRDRRFVFFSPVLLILPRLALQYQAQLTAAFRAP